MAICDWPADERPREKLLTDGAHSLSDAELLAIFLRVGTKGLSAVALAQITLDHFGHIKNLCESDLNAFSEIKGLGMAKYVQFQASIELAKRYLKQSIHIKNLDEDQLKQHIQFKLQHCIQEECWAFLLSRDWQLLGEECLAIGSLEQLTLYSRQISQQFLKYSASVVIIAHNHPHGSLQPSQSDILATQKIATISQLLEMQLHDHMIVNHYGLFSMREHGLLS